MLIPDNEKTHGHRKNRLLWAIPLTSFCVISWQCQYCTARWKHRMSQLKAASRDMLRTTCYPSIRANIYRDKIIPSGVADFRAAAQNRDWPSRAGRPAACRSDTSPGGCDKGRLCWHRESRCPPACSPPPSTRTATGSRSSAGPSSPGRRPAGVLFRSAWPSAAKMDSSRGTAGVV